MRVLALTKQPEMARQTAPLEATAMTIAQLCYADPVTEVVKESPISGRDGRRLRGATALMSGRAWARAVLFAGRPEVASANDD